MFAYVEPYPEISDELYKIDDAMKAGFGWENGPSEFGMLLVLKRKLKSKPKVLSLLLGSLK
jgi:hypothetical protein